VGKSKQNQEENMRTLSSGLAVAVSLVVLVGLATAQKKAEPSDARYMTQALSAAPRGIAKDATVVRMGADGAMKTLRQGKNGFTCMIIQGNGMCADANSSAFFDAFMKHQPPPDKLGLTYMLAGDDGASNTDPAATSKSADNHWVVTGPHIMLVGPGSKALGLTEAPDPDPTKPYMMWAGTPYEHAMIPVAAAKPMAKAAALVEPETK
jgi:hypothetical protein